MKIEVIIKKKSPYSQLEYPIVEITKEDIEELAIEKARCLSSREEDTMWSIDSITISDQL